MALWDDKEPTRDELEAAWKKLYEAKVDRAANISLPELARIVCGNHNYSDAERRMAGGLLILRASLVVAIQALNDVEKITSPGECSADFPPIRRVVMAALTTLGDR